MGLSSQLLGLGEHKKKRANRTHFSVITVNGNTFLLLSELLGPA